MSRQATPQPVLARLKKWPPNPVGFVYYRILCGNRFPSGQFCPAELGHATMIQRRKGRDPSDPASYIAPPVIPRVPGGGGIDHLGLGRGAPEFALVAPEKAQHHDIEGGKFEGIWIVVHDLGYQWVKEMEYFEILKPHKFGLTGANAARRPMPRAKAAALEDRIDPYGRYGFSAEHGVLGDVPTLPDIIRCSRCSTLNHVRPPTNDDLRPPTKTKA